MAKVVDMLLKNKNYLTNPYIRENMRINRRLSEAFIYEQDDGQQVTLTGASQTGGTSIQEIGRAHV